MTTTHSLYDDLSDWAKANAYPLYAHWEITNSCNLSCLHCYLPKARRFVPLPEAMQIISFLEKAGFFSVGLTGGEATIHPNFLEIYRTLKERGFLVTVFTNGTHLTGPILDLFSALPPQKMMISVYGTNEEQYRSVAQRDLFYSFQAGLQELKARHIDFTLQTPLMRCNVEFIDDIERFIMAYEVPYKIGTMIYGMVDGCKDNLSQRLSAETVVRYAARDRQECLTWVEDYERNSPQPTTLRCSAGLSSMVIDVENQMSFCGMLRHPSYSFSDWDTFVDAMGKLNALRLDLDRRYLEGSCYGCGLARLCLGCPAHSYLETGNYNSCIPYFREVAEQKMQHLVAAEMI